MLKTKVAIVMMMMMMMMMMMTMIMANFIEKLKLKKEYKDESNLDPSVDEEFNEIVRYSENLKDKKYITRKDGSIFSSTFNNDYKKIIDDYINKKIKYMDIVDKLNKVNNGIKIYENNKKLYKNSPNIEDQINNSKKFAKGLEKIIVGIDNNKSRIGRDFITEQGSIDLSWMHDPELYEEISQDVFARYDKDKDSNELLSIQTFLDNTNEEYIKNKKHALEEFKTVKNNVKSKNLRDYIKELELAIFGHDDDEELEYKESIAERTKMRRQNKETDKKDISRTFAPPDPDSDDSDKFTEMYYTPYSSIIGDEKTEEETEQTEKGYEEGHDKEGYDGAGYNKWGFNKDGFNEYGFNEYGFNKDGYDEYGIWV